MNQSRLFHWILVTVFSLAAGVVPTGMAQTNGGEEVLGIPNPSAPVEPPSVTSGPPIQEVNSPTGDAPIPPRLVTPTPSASESREKREETDTLETRLLMMSARIDAGFLAGNPVQQGFYIPSIRLSASGEVGELIDYRLSLGQTREFSSILLPQILPVEAFIDISSYRKREGDTEPRLRWRLGMFTPTFNPWWTPDLSDLPLPDYNESHRTLFLSRDIGTELAYEPIPNRLEFGVGIFNGNGIVSLNTNNARAITGFLKTRIPAGAVKLIFGGAGYGLTQSSVGSVNYKSNFMVNGFVALEGDIATLGAEVFGGTFKDSTRSVSPFGGALYTFVEVVKSVKAFCRIEIYKNSPSGALEYDHFQIGPVLQIHSSLQLFTLFDYVSNVGPTESSVLARLRLVI